MPTSKRSLIQLSSPLSRLIISLVIAVVLYLATRNLFLSIRILLAYDVATLIYIYLLGIRTLTATPEGTLYLARRGEPSGAGMILVIVLLSLTSLTAVGFMVDPDPHWTQFMVNLKLGLSLIAVFVSWLLVHVYFALHYASLYYDEMPTESATTEMAYRQGLEFPNEGLADYWDFMYYSFTIAMCYQTSDISVVEPIMRRWTLIHSLLSFLFVAIILGLVVNVISNIV